MKSALICPYFPLFVAKRGAANTISPPSTFRGWSHLTGGGSGDGVTHHLIGNHTTTTNNKSNMIGSNNDRHDDDDGAVFNPMLHASATDVNSDSHKDSVTSHQDHLDHDATTTNNNSNNKKPPLWGTTRSSSRSIYNNDTGSTSGSNSNSVFNPLLKLNNAVSDVIAPINSAMAPILPRYILDVFISLFLSYSCNISIYIFVMLCYVIVLYSVILLCMYVLCYI